MAYAEFEIGLMVMSLNSFHHRSAGAS